MPNRLTNNRQSQQIGRVLGNGAKTKRISDVATTTTSRYTKAKGQQHAQQASATVQQQQQKQQQSQQPSANILNVAEMLLHGVADHEILDIWLQSISCKEFATNFQKAGYDMPTISRITPQDLTAIGITDPAKRLKILSEIKKLNLQDGIPNFRPSSLSHWLSLLRLDSHYFESLCDQQIDTIDKMCQLTWEDFEELGITKLGHQKRLLLAIERMKELDANEAKATCKTISEPIYDTNPSQILLVASAENHSMNGPIINKQSSTSELSSTGSGSMHSVYSSNSAHYQPNYAILPSIPQQPDQQQTQQQHNQANQQQQRAIYNQAPPHPPSQAMSQSPHPTFDLSNQTLPSPFHQQNPNSQYQASQPLMAPPQFMNPIYDTNRNAGRNTMVPQTNRQSLGQLPFSALANLPKHQIQLLQQSSIYATLSRQPQRARQPPPPVPIRTNSLKSNSLIDGDATIRQSHQTAATNANTLMRSGTRISHQSQYNSQTLLSKNKSFSGNAYMEAARARFLDRNNSNQPGLAHNTAQQTAISANNNGLGGNRNGNMQNLIYGTNPINSIDRNLTNGNEPVDSDNLSVYSRDSFATTSSAANSQSNTFNAMHSSDMTMKPLHYQQSQAPSIGSYSNVVRGGNYYDPNSDAGSTKSLILHPSNVNASPMSNQHQASPSQDSGSSQTLYNSASSGSNDQNLNVCNTSQSGDLVSRNSTTSSATLNDVHLIPEQQQLGRFQHQPSDSDQSNLAVRRKAIETHYDCNATTGEDSDFPPPPSPLSLTDSDEHDLLSLNSDKNFTGINKGLMAFRIGT